jgi:hypothetical protein
VNQKYFLTAISLMAFMSISPLMPVWAENPSLKTGRDVKEMQKIEVNGVKIENFAGNVVVKSLGVGKTVRVSLTGSDELLGQVLVTQDHETQKGNLYIAFESNVPVLNDVNKLILTLEMPANMPLDLTLVGGKGAIGPRETNDTKININGFGDIKLASVKNLESKIEGSGEMTIMDIAGNADIAIRGDGKYVLQKGAIPHLKASIGGTGVMEIMANVQNADLKSDGAGTMTLATVTGKLKQSMSGAGSIRISKIEGSFENKISGSAKLEMNCEKNMKK